MPTYDLLITKGKLVIPKQGIIDADLAVKDGKIAAILNKDSQADATETIDEGMDLKGWPVYTLVRGTIVQKDGVVVSELAGAAS